MFHVEQCDPFCDAFGQSGPIAGECSTWNNGRPFPSCEQPLDVVHRGAHGPRRQGGNLPRPTHEHTTPMNVYLLFTRNGTAYAVSANYSHDAIAKVEGHANDPVSCWFLGEKIPPTAIRL
jgi:hypothetical protein